MPSPPQRTASTRPVVIAFGRPPGATGSGAGSTGRCSGGRQRQEPQALDRTHGATDKLVRQAHLRERRRQKRSYVDKRTDRRSRRRINRGERRIGRRIERRTASGRTVRRTDCSRPPCHRRCGADRLHHSIPLFNAFQNEAAAPANLNMEPLSVAAAATSLGLSCCCHHGAPTSLWLSLPAVPSYSNRGMQFH